MERFFKASQDLGLDEASKNESDLIKNLSLAKIPRFKKALFESYYLIFHSVGTNRFLTMKNYLTHLSVLLKQLQMLYLAYYSKSNTSSTEYEVLFNKVLKLCMIDHYAIKDHQNLFTGINLSITISSLVSLLFIYLQIIFKRSICMTPLIIVSNLITWGLNTFYLIPFVIYSLFFIKYAGSSNIYLDFYEASLSFDNSLSFLYALGLLCVAIHLMLVSLFNNSPGFDTNLPRARSYSVIIMKQKLCVIIISALFVFVNKEYFLILTIAISTYIAKELIISQPYYSFTDTIFETGFWVIINISSSLFLIDNSINLNNTSLLILIFISPLAYILLAYYKKKIFESVINAEIRTPQAFEWKLRNKLYKNETIDEETLKEINELFDKATKDFLEFKMLPVWECSFILQSSNSHLVAALKLLKINFAKMRPSFLEKPNVIFEYPLSIECEFFVYSFHKKIKNLSHYKDMAFIKYCKDVFFFNKLDKKFCFNAIYTIDSYLAGIEISTEDLDLRIKKLYRKILRKDDFCKKYTEKYGNDLNLLEKCKVFTDNSKKSTGGLMAKFEEKSEKLFVNSVIKKCGTLIISGFPEIIGRIIYANEHIATMLNYQNGDALIGLNFIKLIPDPFAEMHKDILAKFQLLSRRVQIPRLDIFLLDHNGYSIEVSMDIRAAFYSNIIYFIVEIHQKIPYEYSLLCSPFGLIYTCSEQLNILLDKSPQSIEEIFPNLLNYLETAPMNVDFEYYEQGKSALMKWNEIHIENEKLLVFYFLDESRISEFVFQPPTDIYNKRKRKLTFQGNVIEENRELKKSFSINKRKTRKQPESNPISGSYIKDDTFNVMRNVKTLKCFNCILVIAVLLLYAGIITYSQIFINDDDFVRVLNEVCSIRYDTASILNKIRAIDLKRQNIPLFFDEAAYNESIRNSSSSIKNILNSIDNYDAKYRIKNLFKGLNIIVSFYENGKITQENMTLYQALYSFLERLTQFSASNYTDNDIRLFLYRNGFNNLQNAINHTSFSCMNSVIENSSSILLYLYVLNGLSATPLIIFLVLSIPIMINLQKINKYQWLTLVKIKLPTFLLIRGRAIERINKYYDPEFNQEIQINKLPIRTTNLWWRYFTKATVMVLFSISSYLIIFYLCTLKLDQLIQTRLEYVFYGGLRTNTIKSYFWSREAYLNKFGISYSHIFQEFSDRTDTESFAYAADNTDYFTQLLIKNVNQIRTSSVHFDRFFEFLLGNSCPYTNYIENCTETMLKGGIIPNILRFNNDLRNFVNNKEAMIEILPELEKECDYYEKVLSSGRFLYQATTSSLINEHKDMISWVSSSFAIIIIMYILLILQPQVNKIKDELLSRNEFLILLKGTNPEITIDQ